MANRLLVVYKTPLQRLTEIAIIAASAIAAAALWQQILPTISPSYIIVAASGLGFILIPKIGSRWASRHGAPVMSLDERNRRYLSELGPIGTDGPRLSNFAMISRSEHRIRASGRVRRRARPD